MDITERLEMLDEIMPLDISWGLSTAINAVELSLGAADSSSLVEAGVTPFMAAGDNVLLILLQRLTYVRRLSIDMDFFYCEGLARVLRQQATNGHFNVIESIAFGADDFNRTYALYHRSEIDIPLFL